MPEVYHQLAEGELFLLIPYHPEFEAASFQPKNGMEVPFVRQPDGQGEAFLIFSSEERAQEVQQFSHFVPLPGQPFWPLPEGDR